MLLRAFEFALITFGIAMAVAFLVAALIKLMGIIAQRGEKTTSDSSKQ